MTRAVAPAGPSPVLFPPSPNKADHLTAQANVQKEKGKPICPRDTKNRGVLTPQQPGGLLKPYRTREAFCSAPSWVTAPPPPDPLGRLPMGRDSPAPSENAGPGGDGGAKGCFTREFLLNVAPEAFEGVAGASKRYVPGAVYVTGFDKRVRF